MKTLWCEAGKHEWQRESKRGRSPLSCPEHRDDALHSKRMSGLEKARIAKQKIKTETEKEWAARVETVINNPAMLMNINKISMDARPSTRDKLIYIQEQLTKYRNQRTPSDINNLEKMREKIMEDPYNITGHLL